MSLFGSLVDVDVDLGGLLEDLPEWAKRYALTDERIKALAEILDGRIAFKGLLTPLEIADRPLFESLLKGMIKLTDIQEDN